MRHSKGRGSRCGGCDGVAIPGNPLFAQPPGQGTKFLHLRCGGKDAGISVDKGAAAR